MTTKGQGEVSLSFSANMRYVRPVRHFISSLCAMAGYEEDETESIALVTTEILNNSIEHGTSGHEEEIEVSLHVDSSIFRFEVLDPGRGGEDFAKTARQKSSKMPDLEEPRGRGLFLIQAFMDEMDVSWDPERGTRFVVSKKRTA